MKSRIVNYLRRFVPVSPADEELILDAFSAKIYKAGSVISLAGEIASDLHFINRGMIKITIPQDEEKVATYYFMNEDQFVGLLYSFYGDVPAKQNLQAVNDVELFTIPMSNLLALDDGLGYLKNTINQIAQISMAEMINFRNTYLGLTAAQKYLKLLELQPEVAKTAPLMDIASYLDITPQSLSRIRKQMFSSPGK